MLVRSTAADGPSNYHDIISNSVVAYSEVDKLFINENRPIFTFINLDRFPLRKLFSHLDKNIILNNYK